MEAKTKSRLPEIIMRDGKPAAVILDLDAYQQMLARLEDFDRLQELETFIEHLEEEYFSPEDLAAIEEGLEAIKRGEYISLEEYEKKHGL